MLSFATFLYSVVRAHLRTSLAPGALLLPLIGFASCSNGDGHLYDVREVLLLPIGIFIVDKGTNISRSA